ncbi:anaerobic ribonucleoside-triphosphate reductase activating protein [Desulfurispora sp.]|uniref:anaerobic ribonucleoside-triphosphate reductase activating protein n=1 Tax=Desulfurispora sp. TaxID=3014275 RepID=UPI004049FCE6
MNQNEEIMLRLAGIVEESVVDGPGLRLVVFAQGCPHRCPGCHNPHTWDERGGELVPLAAVLEKVARNPLLQGITLSGGEPFGQAAALAALAAAVRRAGLDVMTYSGYTWEELLEMAGQWPDVHRLLRQTDYLVDGPFVLARRTLHLPFRGSANQRIIDVPASLRAGRAVSVPWA